jgi:hypothetical protein
MLRRTPVVDKKRKGRVQCSNRRGHSAREFAAWSATGIFVVVRVGSCLPRRIATGRAVRTASVIRAPLARAAPQGRPMMFIRM